MFQTPKYGIASLTGTAGISALVSLKDDGCTLWTYSRGPGGGATGMDVQKKYLSLVYDDLSSATGANACVPSVNWLADNPPDPSFNPFDLLQVGAWQRIGQSTRMLCGARTGLAYDALAASVPDSVYALDALGTVSIRRPDQTGPTVALPLVACGAIGPDLRSKPPQPPNNC